MNSTSGNLSNFQAVSSSSSQLDVKPDTSSLSKLSSSGKSTQGKVNTLVQEKEIFQTLSNKLSKLENLREKLETAKFSAETLNKPDFKEKKEALSGKIENHILSTREQMSTTSFKIKRLELSVKLTSISSPSQNMAIRPGRSNPAVDKKGNSTPESSALKNAKQQRENLRDASLGETTVGQFQKLSEKLSITRDLIAELEKPEGEQSQEKIASYNKKLGSNEEIAPKEAHTAGETKKSGSSFLNRMRSALGIKPAEKKSKSDSTAQLKNTLLAYVNDPNGREKLLIVTKNGCKIIPREKATESQKKESLEAIVKFMESKVSEGENLLGVFTDEKGKHQDTTFTQVTTKLSTRYTSSMTEDMDMRLNIIDAKGTLVDSKAWFELSEFVSSQQENLGEYANIKSVRPDGVEFTAAEALSDGKAKDFISSMKTLKDIMNNTDNVDDSYKNYFQTKQSPTDSAEIDKKLSSAKFSSKVTQILHDGNTVRVGSIVQGLEMIISKKLGDLGKSEGEIKAITKDIIGKESIDLGRLAKIKDFFQDPAAYVAANPQT